MLPGTLALLAATAPDDSTRARRVGIWAAVGSTALPAGPLVGGVLVGTLGWRGVFWLSVLVVILALGPILWPGHQSVTTTAPIAALPQGKENKVDRLVLGASCLVAGLMNLCMLGSLFLLTQQLQGEYGLSPLLAGLVTVPAMAPLPLLGVPVGRLVARIGVWRTSALGLAVAAAGFVGMAGCLAGPGLPWLLLALAVWGCGVGVLTPAVVAAALQAAPGRPGLASGASNTARQTGGLVGVAVFALATGATGGVAFADHVVALLTVSAGIFVIAAIGCLVLGRTWTGAPPQPR